MKKRALDAARHKSCHRGECEGGASSLFWQQTKASIPTNLLLEKIGTSCCQVFLPWRLLISSRPQLCACPVLLVLRTRATTPLTGFALPSLANLALTILSWLLHRSVGYIFCVSMTFNPSVFRTAASPAMVWCLAVTMQTLPQTANSTASASRTRSARTPSTRSTSSAPTAPSSTSSSSTATGGQCVFSPS